MLELVAPTLAARIIRRRIERDRIGPDMRYEPEIQLLPALIGESGVALDVGANIGNYSIALSALCGVERVIAVEPIPWLAARLRRLVPELRVEELGLSGHEDRATLRIPRVAGTMIESRSSLEPIVDASAATSYTVLEVAVERLDTFVASRGIGHVSFIKIDVEGHEHEVLDGARDTLRHARPTLLLEAEQRHHSFPLKRVFDRLHSAGYDGLFIDSTARAIKPLQEFVIEDHQDLSRHGQSSYVSNFIFVPRERFDDVRSAVSRLLAVRLMRA